MAKWTAADTADQHGRTVIITGANSGLGAEVTRVVAGAGARVIAACRDVDALINNAGVLAVSKGRAVDGFERHIGTNHLGPFVLTNLLLDRIRARVVTVTSGLHVLGRISPDLNWEHRRYQRWLAHAQSKLANALFAYELQRRLAAAGRDDRGEPVECERAAHRAARAGRRAMARVIVPGAPSGSLRARA